MRGTAIYRQPAYFCFLPAFAVFLIVCVSASAEPAQLARSSVVEFPFDEPVFYFPVDMICTDDSTRYVLNRGDGTVVHFRGDWSVLNRFGQLGDGPGETNAPTALIFLMDTLWVATPQNLVGYSMDGSYLATRKLPWGLTSLRSTQAGLVGTWTGGADGTEVGFRMSRGALVTETFGPRCNGSTSARTADFARCLGWGVVVSSDSRIHLMDHFNGKVWSNLSADNRTNTRDLGLGSGEVLSEWSFQSVVNDVCADSRGGFWVLTYKRSGRSLVCRFDSEWDLKGTFATDPDIGQGAVRVLPDGSPCVLEEKASRLHVFRRPAEAG